MSSEKQAEANRRNAQNSTGPKTQEGKDAVRLNALKHGLRAESLDVLPTESPADYQKRIDAWFRHFNPSNPVYEQLVRHGADVSWKLDRTDRYETAHLSKNMVDAMIACEDQSPEGLAQAAALASFDPSKEGDRLRRYQSSLQREYWRTLDALSKMRPDGAISDRAEVRAWTSAPAPVIGANKPNSAEVRPEPRTVPVPSVAAPIEPKSAAVPPPNHQDPRPQDLFAGIPSPAKMRRADRPAPAPNKANFSRAVRGRVRSAASRPIDLLGDPRPNKANSNPLSQISCLAR